MKNIVLVITQLLKQGDQELTSGDKDSVLTIRPASTGERSQNFGFYSLVANSTQALLLDFTKCYLVCIYFVRFK